MVTFQKKIRSSKKSSLWNSPERCAWLVFELDEVGESRDTRPALLSGSSQCLMMGFMVISKNFKWFNLIFRKRSNLENLWELIKIRVTSQEWDSEQELCEDASHCPDVYSNLSEGCWIPRTTRVLNHSPHSSWLQREVQDCGTSGWPRRGSLLYSGTQNTLKRRRKIAKVS